MHLRVSAIASELDRYFHAQDVREDSWEGILSPAYGETSWRELFEREYFCSWNGLMLRGETSISQVVTCVFPSAAVIDSLEPETLLFTEHPVDLVDDLFAVVDLERLRWIKKEHAGIYQVHGALDQHPQMSPSRLIARAIGLKDVEEYFPTVKGIPGGALVVGETQALLAEVVVSLAAALGAEVPVRLHSQWRPNAGRVAIAAGGGAQAEMLLASLERGCQTYVTGNALSACPLPGVRAELEAFTALAQRERVSVIDGTHYGTEKLSQLEMLKWFARFGLPTRFATGVPEPRHQSP
jgi:putative NIF3 family GTP cyclohydrolase 1 type 2